MFTSVTMKIHLCGFVVIMTGLLRLILLFLTMIPVVRFFEKVHLKFIMTVMIINSKDFQRRMRYWSWFFQAWFYHDCMQFKSFFHVSYYDVHGNKSECCFVMAIPIIDYDEVESLSVVRCGDSWYYNVRCDFQNFVSKLNDVQFKTLCNHFNYCMTQFGISARYDAFEAFLTKLHKAKSTVL